MTSQKLMNTARKYLAKYGYYETPNDWHQYRHDNSQAGQVDISCRMTILSRRNQLNIFARFADPERAIKAGYRCNPHSGKYNFLGITTADCIELFLKHIVKG